uniref:Cellulose synthase-like protein G3 n=1 Tax=Kalanchoe fedtschenkoi TaxID=63787 RepID=A0A7N0VIC3_KALFE
MNRLFAAVYASAILALLYRHTISISRSNKTSLLSLCVPTLLFTADFILAFMWCTTQSFRLFPIRRAELIPEMNRAVPDSEYPTLDVFICTADPYKEPPVSVANTALSVMAYDYPAEKISVYVSDDGGSQLTLFAFTEAAKFAREWLPFCRRNQLAHRSPEAYFSSDDASCAGTDDIKVLYESMKVKVEHVLLKGRVEVDDLENGSSDYIGAFDKWAEDDFTGSEHPAIVHKLLETDKDRDVTGRALPNLIYVSREKRREVPHNFKAGALNVLLRVSGVMTNAPILLTLDCDTFSNDPITAQRALCYFLSQDIRSDLGYVQFPQRFRGINKNDIYGAHATHLFRLNPLGMDGLSGTSYVGTGCFFQRKAFFGSPSSSVTCPNIPPLHPSSVTSDQQSAPQSVLDSAHHVACCDYEKGSLWGSKIGFRYGSLVEDYYTGYRLQCEGWKSVFCDPPRAGFLGDAPITFDQLLNQNKRWGIGLLQVAFSKYTPLAFGLRRMGLLMSLSYSHYAFWPLWAVPLITYSLLPQLTLLTNISIFPKATDASFVLYCFLFVGAYGQDVIEFVSEGSTVQEWWSDQRCWLMKGATCHPSALIEFTMKSLGISLHGFGLTSKVIDAEQGRRYEKGVIEFGVHSSMFVSMTVVALLNLASLLYGAFKILSGGWIEEAAGLAGQLLISGFLVVNYWSVYEGVMFRADRGKMPIKTTVASFIISCGIYLLIVPLCKGISP